MDQQDLLRVVLLIPVFLFSLCVHEFAHAWVADKRGDPTARQMGRLTLHPMAHADLFGTLLLPIVCIYMGAPFFGWAKPVPVDIRNLKHGRRDMTLVAAAGPLSNVLIALFATALLAVLTGMGIEHQLLDTVIKFTVVSIQVNLMLAFFNMIPVPPLDGFNVIHGMLPKTLALVFGKLFRFAPLVLFLLLFTGAFRWIAIPVQYVFYHLLTIAGIT